MGCARGARPAVEWSGEGRLTSDALVTGETRPGGWSPTALLAGLQPFVIWAAASAAVGLLIGALIEVGVVLADGEFDWWFIQQSVLFAEAVGLSGLIATRYAFPHFSGLQPLLRFFLIVLTLQGGVLAATLLSAWQRPGVLVGSTKLGAFTALVIANGLLAMIVAVLLIAWESLQLSLAKALEELRVKERIEREFALARDVQLELLPDGPPRVDGYDVAFSCRPAAVVGGDTLDFIELHDGCLGIAVGDVVGKGLPAALVMANLQSMVRGLALRERDPARLNGILSEVISSRTTAGRFITFAYVRLDPVSGSLSYSLAGHHPPVIAGPNGVRLLEKGGLPLGIAAGLGYESGADVLSPGETLVIYTDGVIEAPPHAEDEAAAADDQYGMKRLVETITGSSGLDSERMLGRILDDLGSYTNHQPLSDDTTIAVVTRPPGLAPPVVS
jgi:sigma-B regulation protein RsbU (phosphoserine phosphatase)